MIGDIIKELGGTVKVARMLDVTPASVSQWINKDTIPPLRAIQLEKVTDGKIKASDLIGGLNE